MTTVDAVRGGEPTQVPRMLIADAIGNVLEWYDFAAYGYFAATFGRNFFPSTDHLVSLLSAFGVMTVRLDQTTPEASSTPTMSSSENEIPTWPSTVTTSRPQAT